MDDCMKATTEDGAKHLVLLADRLTRSTNKAHCVYWVGDKSRWEIRKGK